jgi:hypothetical protein
LLDILIATDVGRQLGRDDSGLDEGHPDAGEQLAPQRLRPPVHAPFGGGVHAVALPGGASRDRGDVDDVAAAHFEVVEEHLGAGQRAEEVDLDHAPVVVPLVGAEWPEQHDPGVVDQDVGAAELLLHALGRGDDRRPVRDVGLDGD